MKKSISAELRASVPFIGSDFYWMAVGLLAFFFVLPAPSNEWLFQLGKLSFTGIALVFTAAFIFLNREKYVYRLPKALYLAIISYLIWITLTNTVFSSQPQYTLLGWKGWNGGLFANMLYWFTLLLTGFTPKIVESDQSRGVIFLLTSALFSVSVLTMLEFLGFHPLLGGPLSDFFKLDFTDTTYPILTVGNSGWIAGIYALLASPIIYFALTKKFGYMYLTLFFYCFGVSATQSNLMALLFSLMSLTLAAYLLINKHYRNYLTASVLLIFAVSPPFITDTLIGVSRTTDRANEFDYAQSASSASDRLTIFRSALRSSFERPLVGWGYETFHFNFYRNLSHDEEQKIIKKIVLATENETVERHDLTITATSETNGVTNRRSQVFLMVKPHNYLIEELYSNGAIAILALSYIVVFSALILFKKRDFYSLSLFMSLILYFSYLMGWFLNPSVTFLAMAFLGISLRTQPKTRQLPPLA